MFTGIIECTGTVVDLTPSKGNLNITIHSRLTEELQIDQSISHNGICMTVVDVLLRDDSYMVTAIDETLKKTNLGDLCINDQVNLERSMLVNGRLDGHIVQGHVDQVAVCTRVEDMDGSWIYTFEFNEESDNLIVEKGSICVNGVSLTVVKAQTGLFSVAIIPYTWQYTNFNRIREKSKVNIEFDIIGKYVARMLGKNVQTY
jgi:riboflavin synthase